MTVNSVYAIETGKTVSFERLASYRSKIRHSEINGRLRKFVEMLNEKGVKKSGPIITATHAMEPEADPVLDVEFMVPIDREIPLEGEYAMKDRFYIENALHVRHEGDINHLPLAIQALSQYILEKKLQQVTVFYNVNTNDDRVPHGETPIIDIYAGVTNNIL